MCFFGCVCGVGVRVSPGINQTTVPCNLELKSIRVQGLGFRVWALVLRVLDCLDCGRGALMEMPKAPSPAKPTTGTVGFPTCVSSKVRNTWSRVEVYKP